MKESQHYSWSAKPRLGRLFAVSALALGFLWAGDAVPAQAAQCLDTTTYMSSDRVAEQYFRQGSAYYRSQFPLNVVYLAGMLRVRRNP
jgi:hypothetical protein